MVAVNTVTQFNGWFKQRYADKVEQQIPGWKTLCDDVPFKKQPKLGDRYHFPVNLQREHGVTFNAGGTAYALNASVAGLTQDATDKGTSFVIRSRLAYDTVSQATSSKEAFGRALDHVVMNMIDSCNFYKEMCMLYGQTNIGDVESVANSATGGTITISVSQWSPGIWAQMEGGKFDVESGTTRVTVTCESVDLDARQVVYSGTTSTAQVSTTSDLIIVNQGSSTSYGVFPGLDRITTNTTSLYGISAATYGIWQSNTSSATGSLTMKKLSQLTSDLANRSRLGPRRAYCGTHNWADLNDDHAALRRFNQSTKNSLDLGTGRITYYGPTGPLEIVPHPMVKVSEVFVVDPRHLKRIGASDLSFDLPGSEGHNKRFLRELPDSAGFEIRAYWNQTLCCNRPAALGKISGLTPTAFA